MMCTQSISAEETPVAVSGAKFTDRRLRREFRTMTLMMELYCRGQHKSQGELCTDCQNLLTYAELRLDRCRFGPAKPTCAKCPVHCYQKKMRDEVKVVMRYSGPRLLRRHPILSFMHWLDGFRPVPEVK